ncbi:MAG: type II toxin-antitoxin system VapB family antitoxin [Microthrixaceae bacterium]
MSRTNIELDDQLVDRAMRMYRLDSKRAAVQLALERLVGDPMTRDEVLAMQGTGFGLTNDGIEELTDAPPMASETAHPSEP